jgi:hypothetical protein
VDEQVDVLGKVPEDGFGRIAGECPPEQSSVRWFHDDNIGIHFAGDLDNGGGKVARDLVTRSNGNRRSLRQFAGAFKERHGALVIRHSGRGVRPHGDDRQAPNKEHEQLRLPLEAFVEGKGDELGAIGDQGKQNRPSRHQDRGCAGVRFVSARLIVVRRALTVMRMPVPRVVRHRTERVRPRSRAMSMPVPLARPEERPQNAGQELQDEKQDARDPVQEPHACKREETHGREQRERQEACGKAHGE